MLLACYNLLFIKSSADTLSVGPNESNLDEIPFRDSSAAMSDPVPLFTGDKETEFPSDYGTDGFVLVKQEQPLPMTILAIYARLELYDT